ncbi:MAG TPA: hypothetical protein DEH25_09805 [Chloroflexi bacterium]|nr:hypothetical protein [Chloroflexota bacterium]HBY06808.1 hypothetical protein [Chloroflexota bacterium]
MNHQPFENWLFSEEPLPENDERTLRNHLADCEQCSSLEDAWLDVANLFETVPEVDPAPGFVNRWQITLEADRVAAKAARQRWQSWILLVLIANGAALALVLTGVQLFRTYGSFSEFVLSWVYRAATLVVIASGIQNVFVTLARTLPILVPTSWWVGIVITLSMSTLLWIVSMAKLTSLPRRTS